MIDGVWHLSGLDDREGRWCPHLYVQQVVQCWRRRCKQDGGSSDHHRLSQRAIDEKAGYYPSSKPKEDQLTTP